MIRATSLLGAASVGVAALGLLKNLIAASYFGTSRAMDTYLLALTVPDMAQYLSITGLFNFIPLFSEAKARHGDEEALRTAGRLITYWYLILSVVLIACFLGAGILSWLVVPGLDDAERSTYVTQTRLLMFMALSMGFARVLAAVHTARKRFFVPALGEVTFQLASIGYLVVFHSLGTIALVGGMVFGGFCQLAVGAGALRVEKVRVNAVFEPRHPAVRKLVRLALPVYVGNGASKLNQAVNAAFSSTLTAGAVSALQYAYMMVDMLASTVGASLARAVFPFLADSVAQDRKGEIDRGLTRGLVGTALVTMPAAVGLLALAHPVVVLVFKRGSFDASSASLTETALRIYAPALFALSMNQVFATILYAKRDTVTPMRLGLLRVAVSALICALTVPSLGHRGIALATTTAEALKAALMMMAVWRLGHRDAMVATLRSLAGIAASVAVMAAVVVPLAQADLVRTLQPRMPGLAALAGTCLAGMLVYVLALRVVAARDFAYFGGQLRGLVSRRRPAQEDA